MSNLFVQHEGSLLGPFDDETVKVMLRDGQLTQDSMVARNGYEECVPLRELLAREDGESRDGEHGTDSGEPRCCLCMVPMGTRGSRRHGEWPAHTQCVYTLIAFRAGAFIVDVILGMLLVGVVSLLLWTALELLRPDPDGPVRFLVWSPVLVYIVFFLLRDVLTGQGSPGKLFLGLKVVDSRTGKRIKLSQSVFRNILMWQRIAVLILFVQMLAFGYRWGDDLAGTVVLRRWSDPPGP